MNKMEGAVWDVAVAEEPLGSFSLSRLWMSKSFLEKERDTWVLDEGWRRSVLRTLRMAR